jgi:hypothetical protein
MGKKRPRKRKLAPLRDSALESAKTPVPLEHLIQDDAGVSVSVSDPVAAENSKSERTIRVLGDGAVG